MKNTPFQQALKNELERIERLSFDISEGNHSLVSFKPTRTIKSRGFLLQFFRPFNFLKASTR